MRAIEFETSVERNGTIAIPDVHRDLIAHEEKVRVVVLWPEEHEDDPWEREGSRTFLEGDGPSDYLYD